MINLASPHISGATAAACRISRPWFLLLSSMLFFFAASDQAIARSTTPGRSSAPSVVRPIEGPLAHIKLGSFPRLMGMNIGAANYLKPRILHRIIKLDIVILNFYPGWHEEWRSIRYVVQRLKTLNPRLLVGQYTDLDEAYTGGPAYWFNNDIAEKLRHRDWWLRGYSGHRVQWTTVNHTYEINFTRWTHPDSRGRRYPEWLAQRDYRTVFAKAPFDIWYFDDVNLRERVHYANWKQNGGMQNSYSSSVERAYRDGQADEWAEARRLDPNILLMGNADNNLHYQAYRNRLQGAFLEGLMGYRWSLMTYGGWDRMMHRYHAIFHNLAYPRIVGFNVAGSPKDYRFFRFAFASCLMDNGYFSFTNKKKIYTSVPWFDEYNVKLGQPLDPPQTKPWRNGVYRRRFQYGMVLLNPTGHTETVHLSPGYRRFRGAQDPRVNNGQPVSSLTLPARDGIVLIASR